MKNNKNSTTNVINSHPAEIESKNDIEKNVTIAETPNGVNKNLLVVTRATGGNLTIESRKVRS